jgi:two-component system, LytTR family, response regulator
MSLKCIIVDDEQHAIDLLADYIAKTPGLELLKSYTDPLKALTDLNTLPIDLAFIDVQMPNLTGIQFLKLLDKSIKIVLCTAYSDYAVDAFELNVVDYLLKPVPFERFLMCTQKLISKDSSSLPSVSKEKDFIFLKTEAKGKYVKVNLADICYIEGLGNYQKIHCTDTMIVAQFKMKILEEQLGPYGFVRVHKSFLVPIRKINTIEGNLLKINKFEVPIGQSFKEHLFSLLKERMLE